LTRPETLIRDLGLKPHPEGGWYAEVFRSPHRVTPQDHRADRAALTSIYFLLLHGQCSALHRVLSDEAWHFHEGGPLRLVTCDPTFRQVDRITLGSWDGTARPTHVVPAGHWQAAESLGGYTLVACTVGPGFDFADFSLLRDDLPLAHDVRARHADLVPYL